ncbi:hypothetical protein VTO73DRAFT_1797 [Trametes versicolor]
MSETRLGSAAAAALSNPDLLFELFEHLSPFPQLDIVQLGEIPSERFKHYSWEVYRRGKTLANAALTCKDFTEPASSVLWRVLYPGLHPLFYPFPGFHKTAGLLKAREVDEFLKLSPISNHVLEREPTPAEWERWKICVRRVRCINLRNTRAAFFEEPYIPLLLHANAGVPILPTLRSIIFNEPRGNRVQTRLLHALISPTLSTISVYNGILRRPFSAHILDDLKAISESCGGIQRLSIRADARSFTHNLPLSLFPRLRMLHLALSWSRCRSMIYEAGALKRLECLFLSCETSAKERRSMSGIGGQVYTASAFPALRTLKLRAPPPQAAEILSSISSTSLQDVNISSSPSTFRTEVPALLNTFPWKQNASSLRRLVLNHTPEWGTIGVNGELFYAAFFNIFAPLADLHALEHLEIACWSRVLSISDADVAQMSRAWPHLQHIAIEYTVVPPIPTEPPIQWDPYGQTVARPSLPALVNLAERCPALFYCNILAASMSEEELVTLEAYAAAAEADNRPRQTNLRNLILACGGHCDHFALPDADRVAHALLVLFPSLCGVDRGGMARWKVDLLKWSISGTPVSEEHRCQTDVFRLLFRIFELSGQEMDGRT